MVSDFMGQLIAGMRAFAGLDQDEFAERIGVSTRALQRMENNQRKTPIKRELERKIVEVSGVTDRDCAQILADTASKHFGVNLVVLPADTPVPSPHVMAALRSFANHGHKLDKKEWDSIESLLINIKGHNTQTEGLSKTIAKDIIQRINDARIKLGEDPAADSEE